MQRERTLGRPTPGNPLRMVDRASPYREHPSMEQAMKQITTALIVAGFIAAFEATPARAHSATEPVHATPPHDSYGCTPGGDSCNFPEFTGCCGSYVCKSGVCQ
jgi:hypothetical protein